ncbi:MAG: hypothetical protein FJ088_05955 [Deltaproteobacteria bacterium]|nr:hypothetical protein [Deltaproteobacteria bacterium]
MKALTNSTKIGAAAGFVAFILVAAAHAVLYGGYFGLIAAGWIFGTPVTPDLPQKLIIFAGMLMSILVVGGFFTFVGAAVGHLAGVLLKPVAEEEKADGKEKARL